MSITSEVPRSGPAAVLAGVIEQLRGVDATLWPARSDDELIDTVGLVQAARSVLAAVEAGALVEADTRDLPRQRLHYGSTGDWLTHTGGLRTGEGKRVLARAHALAGPMGRTRQALVDGHVSPGQADVIVHAVGDLPGLEWDRRRGEKVMLRHARSLDASDLARAGRHLATVVDPDGADRRLEAALDRDERAAHQGRYLSIVEDRAGGVRLRGRGSIEDAAVLKAALLPLTCPRPTTSDDGEEVRDPRDSGARLWDALVRTAQHALDTDLQPAAHGARPRLLVTLDHDTLKARLAGSRIGVTTDGHELPASTLRRLACDADLIPVVLGTRGEILDIGRTARLVTTPIWTALVARDRHCTFPACTRPPSMCHAHHLRHWADGGETSLANLALLCGHHHRTVHHTPWEIRLSPDDRRPEFRPPPQLGITPDWIRQRPRRT
jgi:hypothetical protein